MNKQDHDTMVRAGYDPRLIMAGTRRAQALGAMTEEDRQVWLDHAEECLRSVDHLYRIKKVKEAAEDMDIAIALHYNDLTQARIDMCYRVANAIQAQYIELLQAHTRKTKEDMQ